MDNENHDSIVKMFYLVQLTEPLIEAKGNETVKKIIKELKAAIIAYLYSCKMVEEARSASEQLSWSVEVLKYLRIIGDKTNALNEVIEDWNRNK